MKKRFMRMAAAVLAALLVVTTVNPLAIEVSAAESAEAGVKKTYTMEELGNAGSFVYDISDLEVATIWDAQVDTSNGEYSITFPKQYTQIFYKFPEGITADRLKSVSVEVDNVDKFCIKLSANRDNFVAGAEAYGSKTVSFDAVKEGVSKDEVCILGLMSTLNGEAVKKIGKVTFELAAAASSEEPTPETTKTVVKDEAGVYTFKPADLKEVTRWGTTVDTADGKYDVNFPKQYDQIFYEFPEGVTAERINSVTVNTNAEAFCIKLAANRDNFATGAEEYGKTTITLNSMKEGVEKSEVCILGLMSTLDGSATKSIESVSFDLKAKEEAKEDKPSEEVADKRVFTYKVTDLAAAGKWGTEIIPNEDGSAKVTFEKQYSQLFLTIPDSIDVRRIEEVNVDTDAANFSVKFCKADSSHTEVGVVYGNTTIKDTNVTGNLEDIGEIGLMNLLDGANEKTVKSITIKLGDPVIDDPNAPVKGDLTVDCFKDAANNNPLATQRYSADPGVMVYGDTVYVYSTNDVYQYAGKKLGENTYAKITTINCYSSKDLVNWTDNGAIAVAGKQNAEGAAKWANNSWAPCAAHKTIDGKEKFFLYFADNGSGIGVLTSDSPTGPFVDPIGTQLVSRKTPTCNEVTWLFDPAVFVDDDGTGYLCFGGGIPDGKAADPGTARIVKLGADMISLDGDPVQINPPYLFEDSGINKIGDKYYYSYCSNFNGGNNFRSGTIHYMVSDNPMGPYTYVGAVMANPSSAFNDGNGNNHHSIFEFNGEYYIAYHARALEKLAVGSALGYRTTQIDKLTVSDGKINEVTPTMKGVAQTATLNPYEAQKATTIYRQKGVEVLGSGNTVLTVTAGDFAGVRGVNFNAGASAIEMTIKASEALTVDVLTGSENGTKVGTINVDATNGEYKTVKAEISNISGTTDLYFVYSGAAEVASWKVDSAEYSLDDLTSAGGYGFSLVKDEAGKTVAIDYEKQYQEARYNIPESILAAGIKSIEVVTDDASKLSIKTLDASGNQIEVTYGNKKLDVTKTEGVVAIALMNLDEGKKTINISGVKFTTDEIKAPEVVTPEKPTETKEPIVLGSDELSNLVNPWNGSDVQGPSLKYSSQYQEYDYIFDEAIPSDNIESIVVKVKDQGGNICIKFYDGVESSEWFHDYGADGNTEYTYKPEEGKSLKKIGFMSMLDPDVEGNYPYGITIESVTIKLKAGASTTVKNEETYVYEGDTLNFREHWGEDSQPIGNTLTFEKRWDEYVIDLGREIDMERVKSLKIKVKDQGNSISFKVYADPAKDSEDGKDVELKADYGKSGSTTYTFPAAEGIATKFAVMAQPEAEEGVYPFSVTIESVTIVYDTAEREVVEKGVEYDIINLRDAVAKTVGDDFLIGTAMSYDEFGDANDIALALKHFNAITLGNELKPDSILGSSHGTLKTVSLNGVEFEFPELGYSNPERRLDVILKYNDEHPDNQIKVRGHVLVWHSQMPTWFFREGYSSSGAYVSKEVMNLRLEYYIKTVAEHFFGEDSKYKDMFYGWDVVNEAVSDGGGYRKDFNGKTTDWWAIYGSNEFINNAFVYANKYFPKSVELYYNDYNDTSAGKVGSIEQLLRDVKATPGARIDGFGMQAHYNVSDSNPSIEAFMDAARRYAAIVDVVQVTELDFKGSSSSKDEQLAKRYLDIYNAIRRLREEGVNFTGMTIWGVTDKHSWLQSQNNVGGGSTTNSKQYPLLFDDNYKAKNSFWALVEAGELMPEEKTVTIVKSADDKFSAGISYTFKSEDGLVTVIPEVYEESKIRIKVVSPDKTQDAADKVTVYYAYDDEKGSVTATRNEFKTTADGYEAVLEFPVDYNAVKSNKVIFDVVVNNNGKMAAFGDTRLKQTIETTYYAKTVFKNSEKITKGTATVDGKADDSVWTDATELVLAINKSAKATATAKLAWDEENLYVLATVKDATLDDTASAAHEKDSVEIFIDENNHKSNSYEEDDKQYRVNYKNEQSFNGTKCKAENITSVVTLTEDGYIIETAIKWTDLEVKAPVSIGFEIQVNDAEGGKRIGTLNWADTTDSAWSSPSVFGSIVLIDQNAVEEPEEKPSEGNNGGTTTPSTTPSNTSAATESRTESAETTTDAAVPTTTETYVRPQDNTDVAAVAETAEEVKETAEVVTETETAKAEEPKATEEVKEVASETVENKEITDEETPLAHPYDEKEGKTALYIVLAAIAAIVVIGGATWTAIVKKKAE